MTEQRDHPYIRWEEMVHSRTNTSLVFVVLILTAIYQEYWPEDRSQGFWADGYRTDPAVHTVICLHNTESLEIVRPLVYIKQYPK